MKRTPITRKTPLRARTPMRRIGITPGKSSVNPVRAQRPPVTAVERAGRAAVRARCGGICEVCSRVQATEWQHRKPRSAGGTWDPSNGLAVCYSCHHKRIHANPSEAYAMGWSVKRAHVPAKVPVYAGNGGWARWVWLRDDGSMDPVSPDELDEVRARLGWTTNPREIA